MTGAVLHLDTATTWRGGQQQVYLLHRELLARGVDSRLLARQGGALEARCREERLPVAALPGERAWQPRALARLWRHLPGVHILHAHDSHGAGLAALARRTRAGLRFVCHRRVSYPLGGNPLSRAKYALVDRWVAVSAEVADTLAAIGASGSRVSVVHSALDLAAFRRAAAGCDRRALAEQMSLPDGVPVVGLCGAFSSQKGHRTLVEAAVLLGNRDVRYLLVGEGALRQEIERLVEAGGLGRRFRFAGFRSDVAAITSLFTAAVVPSVDGEGSSAAAKEPMALGVPVIASDLPGNLEVVGDAALTFPRGDATALAGCLAQLLDDPARRRALAAEGKSRVEAFTPESMADGVLDAYRQVLR